MTIELAPSILSANFARLADDAKAALEGGGTVLHLDVMDGHFVPNISFGPAVCAATLVPRPSPDSGFPWRVCAKDSRSDRTGWVAAQTAAPRRGQ